MSQLLVRNPNIYYGEGRRRLTRRRRGRGSWDKIKSAHNWIKNNKIISTVGNALSGVPGIGSIAGTIGRTAATFGYGRPKRRRVGVRRRRPVMRLPSGLRMTVRRRVIVRRRPLVRRRYPLVRRRLVRRIRVGGSLRSIASRLHGFVKGNQLVSKGLNHFGHSKLASVASSFGYGRRRVRRRRIVRRTTLRRRRAPVRRHRGGANFFSTEQLAAPKF